MLLARIGKFLYRKEKAAENTLLLKLDFFILTYACLASLVGKLDNTNLSNAWVSGLPEELGLHASQYSKITSLYQAGYAISQLPANLMLLWIAPRFVMPTFVVLMCAVSLGTSFAQNLETIQGLRFVLGCTEAANYCCLSYLLGSWYNQQEMGKRAGIYTAVMHLGSVISGPIQTGINSSLAGHLGRSGWRWLFIIDAVITFPIALWGYCVLPDTPSKTKAFYLTEEEKELSRTRMKPRDILVFKKESILKVLLSWQWTGFMGLGVLIGMVEIFIFNGLPALYFKGFPEIYSVADANNLPSICYVLAMLANIFGAALTDYLGNRFFASFFLFTGGVIGASIFLAWPVHNQGVMQFAVYIQGIVFAGQASFFTWANECTAYDPFLRTFTVGSMNLAAYIWLIWYGLVVFTSESAPRFKAGNTGTVVSAILVVPYAYWIYWKAKRTPGAVYGKIKKDETEKGCTEAADKDSIGLDSPESREVEEEKEKNNVTVAVAPVAATVPQLHNS